MGKSLYDFIMQRQQVTRKDYERLGNGEITDPEEIRRILATPYDELEEGE